MAGVRDRLPELQQSQKLLKVDKEKKKPTKTKDTMDSLQTEVRKVDAQLVTVTRNIEEMEKIQRDIISSPFCDKNDVYKYEQLVNNIQQVSGSIRNQVKTLEEGATASESEGAIGRIRRQQVNRLTGSLAQLTNKFFKAQADYMDKMKERMRTQLEVTRGTNNLSEEEINDILQKDDYSAFTQNFISDIQDAEGQLRQIEDRQKDILALEKSVFEVNQLFKDISVVVHDQGTTIDSIEANVTTAATQVEEGNVQLKQAKKHRTKNRRCKIILAVVGLVALLVVVLIILGAVGVI